MPEEIKDVKPDAASSAVQDVTATSSVDKTAETDVKTPSLLDVAKAALEESNKAPSAEQGKDQSGSTIDQDQDRAEVKKEETSAEQETEEEKGPIPYERFAEVNTVKNTLEAKVKEYEPLVEAQQSVVKFCQENSISEEQFRNGMQILALINSDPIEAKKLIEPIWNQLSGLTGEVLPADLQQELDEARQELQDGVISQAAFGRMEKRAHELAQLRGRSQIGEAKSKINERQMADERSRVFVTSVQSALVSWGDSKKMTDPDFAPKKDGTADGKYEWFAERFYNSLVRTPPKTVADAIKLAEQAYTSVNQTLSRFTTRTTSSKVLSSTKSSATSKKEPTTLMEAILPTARKHGMS